MKIEVYPENNRFVVEITAENDNEELDLYRFDDKVTNSIFSKKGVRTVFFTSDKRLSIIFDDTKMMQKLNE